MKGKGKRMDPVAEIIAARAEARQRQDPHVESSADGDPVDYAQRDAP